MEILQTIFFMLLALGVLVTVHEFGHFWVARRCGVKVLRFSVGFGTALFRWKDKQQTEYVLAALPLGGYVKMVDEREGDVAPEDLPFAFNRKPVWSRIAIVVAGPLANFLLAIVVYWVVFLAGVQGVAPVVGDVIPGSIAELGGLQTGEEIVAVDDYPTTTSQALRERLIYSIGETRTLLLTVTSDVAPSPVIRELSLDRWLSDEEDLDPVKGLGIDIYRPEILPVADQIMPDSPAEKAGMVSGDRILSAGDVAIDNWSEWVVYVRARANQPVQTEIQRGEQRLVLDIIPEAVTQPDGSTIGQVGMSVVIPEWPQRYLRTVEYSVPGAFTAAVVKTGQTSVMILDSIKKMMEGLISAKHLSGPITIAKVAGTSAQYGPIAFMSFLAFLSVSLGVLNLLPIPVLDGGHLMYYLIEVVKGSPVSERIQAVGFRFGVLIVVGLMVVAFYNDLTRL